MKLRHSILGKFLLIIMIAVLFIPIVIPVTSAIFYIPILTRDQGDTDDYYNGVDLEKMWHKEAALLGEADAREINNKLIEIKEKYPDATLFWVNNEGKTQKQLPVKEGIPQIWSSSFTVDFMKKSYDSDPFTTVAFIGGNRQKGFMVMQMPRNRMNAPIDELRSRYDFLYSVGLLGLFVIFIFLSWLFVYKLRKRLLYLQNAMAEKGPHGIPEPVSVGKKDEIGQLEHAFNRMIGQLKEGREREQEEEMLRRQLIANLSHDLRTPLTTLRGHVYSLKKDQLSDQGKESIEMIDRKITYIGQLLDNLLSYTLLSSGKYPYYPQKVDVLRNTRLIVASWYPVFEKEGFNVNIDLPEKKIEWTIDPGWFERIIDNLFQNIIRHTKEGRYVGISGFENDGQFTLMLEDHGQGLNKESTDKGAGIGLSIVSMMLKEMDLTWEIDSDRQGTRIMITNVKK